MFDMTYEDICEIKEEMAVNDKWHIERERICGCINRGECPSMNDIGWMLKRHDELVKALRPLALVPVEDFGKENRPEYPLMGWNDHKIFVRDVLAARTALGEKLP